MDIRKQAAAFYLAAAKGTSVDHVMTPDAADRLGRAFEVCYNSRKRRQTNKDLEEKQALENSRKAAAGHHLSEIGYALALAALLVLMAKMTVEAALGG